MKYLGSAALSLLLLVALASCYWMGNIDTGSLTMDFSQIQARPSGDIVRVYLLANGLLFSAGSGQPFAAEVPLGADGRAVVKIDGLPVGPRYRALVGAGYVDQGVFYVDHYGESEEFEVSAGDDTTVPTTLSSVYYYLGFEYSTDLMGKNLVGVAAGSFYVYAAEASKLHAVDSTGSLWDSYDLAADRDGLGVSSYRVNGLSQDHTGFFLDAFMDSNMGILPLYYNGEGWEFDTAFSSELGGNRQIEESGVFDPGNDRAVFFRRTDGIGGRIIGTSTGSWRNINVDDVTDLTLSNNYAYFAAEGDAFALNWDFLPDPQPRFEDKRTDLSSPAEILSLGYATTGILYMGTTDGAWVATIRTEPNDFYSLTQIPETAGEAIEMIAVSSSGSYQAFLSRYFLYVRNPSYVDKYPFFAILPGKVTGMTWFGDSRLYISGTEGLSVLYISST
jgi:hypothetical protein